MTLHPQARALLDMVAATGGIEVSDARLAEIRTGWAMLVALGCGDPEAVAEVTDLEVPSPAGAVPIRAYLPAEADAKTTDGLPVVVFFHGGGWTIGSVADYDPIARRIANAAGALVVSVDYRLAPEAPHPAAVDDCWAATTWIAEHAADLGGDGTRLALMGDSAGGNLAAVIAQRAAREGGPAIALQALIYPVVDCDMTRGSYELDGDDLLLDRTQMEWFFDCYTRGGADRTDPTISAGRADLADLAGLPPAVVITAEYDPLRDEGEAYAAALRAAGVEVAHSRYDGMIHGFFGLGALLDAGNDAVAEVGRAVRAAFGTL
ncbi:MAG TPA: alpha/beta hydrolase [Acidimicrobiia bacterium]|jgi:acetyl esterase|nr:alpha/beta hydrolase [Acidimicrobiia bacterium]